jgi:hypothetical protein
LQYLPSGHAISGDAPRDPVFFELLGDARVPARSEIVRLLSLLAIGYDEEFIPKGLNAAEFRAQRRAFHESLTPEFRDEYAEFGLGPLIEIDCYDAARQGVARVASLLDSQDLQLRCGAAHFLAWFSENAGEIVTHLEAMLQRATEPLEQAHAILALGLIAGGSQTSSDRSKVVSYRETPFPLAGPVFCRDRP